MSEQLLPQSSQPSELLHIRRLVKQLNSEYQAMRSERHRLAQWEEEQDFSILGEIEVFAAKIQGYAGQIMAQTFESRSMRSLIILKTLSCLKLIISRIGISPRVTNTIKLKAMLKLKTI